MASVGEAQLETFGVRRSHRDAVLEACGVAPSARSPLYDPQAGSAPAPQREPAAWLDAASQPPDTARRALAVLCDPELVLRIEDDTIAGAPAVELYASDAHVVGVRLGADGTLLFAEPVTLDALRDRLVDLVVHRGKADEMYSVPDGVLLVLDALVAAGLGTGEPTPADVLLAAAVELGLDDPTATRVLAGLQADRLVERDGDACVLGPGCAAWRQALPLSSRLTLTAVALAAAQPADAATVSSALTFAGGYGQRLLVTADLDADEESTLFVALTEDDARATVARLLQPEPGMPRFTPEQRAGAPVAGWRTGVRADAPTLSGPELLALYDLVVPSTEPYVDAPAEPEELRDALLEGRALLARRGLTSGDPPTVEGAVAEILRAWLDPALVVAIERTDPTDGTVEIRCCVRGDVLVVEQGAGTDTTIDVAASAELVSAVAELAGLTDHRAGSDAAIELPLGDAAAHDAFLRTEGLVLVRVSVQWHDGDTVVGGQLAFACAGDGRCWEIEEPVDLGDDTAPIGVTVLQPADSARLLQEIAGWLP